MAALPSPAGGGGLKEALLLRLTWDLAPSKEPAWSRPQWGGRSFGPSDLKAEARAGKGKGPGQAALSRGRQPPGWRGGTGMA